MGDVEYLCVAKVFLLIRRKLKENGERREFMCVQYIEMACPRGTVEKALNCIFAVWYA